MSQLHLRWHRFQLNLKSISMPKKWRLTYILNSCRRNSYVVLTLAQDESCDLVSKILSPNLPHCGAQLQLLYTMADQLVRVFRNPMLHSSNNVCVLQRIFVDAYYQEANAWYKNDPLFSKTWTNEYVDHEINVARSRFDELNQDSQNTFAQFAKVRA